jgi:alpha-tubulin suppressor-like RCC1 family protein
MTLWAWGANKYGQLGLGDTITRETPNQIGTESDWLKVIAGGYATPPIIDIIDHTVALKTNGQLWAWGANGSGQLGDDSVTMRTTPRQIGNETDWTMITAGSKHTLSIKTNGSAQPPGGTLWAWGYNGYGQLGLGGGSDRKTPSQIGTDSDWSMVVAGGCHTITLKRDGTIWSWGSNRSGQLGLGDTTNRNSPVQVGMETDWSELAAGGQYLTVPSRFIGHTIARKTNGVIWAWGDNSSGQLGLGDTINRTTPSQIGLNTDWTLIIAGNQHTFAIKINSTLWSWGKNNYGQLGLGDTINRYMPMMVGE